MGDASFRPHSSPRTSKRFSRRRRSELVLWTNDTGSTRQEYFVTPNTKL